MVGAVLVSREKEADATPPYNQAAACPPFTILNSIVLLFPILHYFLISELCLAAVLVLGLVAAAYWCLVGRVEFIVGPPGALISLRIRALNDRPPLL